MSVHHPLRPSWRCAGCGGEWPCPTRRQELLAQFDGSMVSLTVYLVSLLVDACRELPRTPAGELHARFVDWVHPAGAHRADPS